MTLVKYMYCKKEPMTTITLEHYINSQFSCFVIIQLSLNDAQLHNLTEVEGKEILLSEVISLVRKSFLQWKPGCCYTHTLHLYISVVV